MTFRITNENDIIDNGILSYCRYIGRSTIDFSKIYKLDTYYSREVLEKMYDRDESYLFPINIKNKINKLKKSDKISINDYFIDFYLKNINHIYLIKTD